MKIPEWQMPWFFPEEEFHIKESCPKCGSAKMPVGVEDGTLWAMEYRAADKEEAWIDGNTIPLHDRGEYMMFRCRRCGYKYPTKTKERE